MAPAIHADSRQAKSIDARGSSPSWTPLTRLPPTGPIGRRRPFPPPWKRFDEWPVRNSTPQLSRSSCEFRKGSLRSSGEFIRNRIPRLKYPRRPVAPITAQPAQSAESRKRQLAALRGRPESFRTADARLSKISMLPIRDCERAVMKTNSSALHQVGDSFY